jgi:hypothetical protein
MNGRDDNAIFEALRRHDLDFVIVGGHAVYFHGYARLTEDVDVVWLRTEESEKKLLTALTEIDARYIGKEIDPATGIERDYPVTLPYIRSTHLMLLVTRFGFLDIFDFVPGFLSEDPKSLFTSSVESNGLKYVSKEWLLKMKVNAGRTKDKSDLEKLPE